MKTTTLNQELFDMEAYLFINRFNNKFESKPSKKIDFIGIGRKSFESYKFINI